MTLSLAVAVALCGPASARAETETRAPYTVIHEGRASIGVDEEVGDLLVVGARAELAGVVRGHVYAVEAELVVRSTAVVLRSMTVVGGSVRIEDGAVLPEEIALADARLEDGRGQPIPQTSGPMRLGRSSTSLRVEAV
ncbi:hypothetical protein L6R52_24565, partial [Myxococcota bacterium]|nr:hypothetical protein [Myxococcota bacterium]